MLNFTVSSHFSLSPPTKHGNYNVLDDYYLSEQWSVLWPEYGWWETWCRIQLWKLYRRKQKRKNPLQKLCLRQCRHTIYLRTLQDWNRTINLQLQRLQQQGSWLWWEYSDFIILDPCNVVIGKILKRSKSQSKYYGISTFYCRFLYAIHKYYASTDNQSNRQGP